MFQVSFGSVFFCYFFFKFFIATFQKRSTQTTTSPNDQKKNKEENTESIFNKKQIRWSHALLFVFEVSFWSFYFVNFEKFLLPRSKNDRRRRRRPDDQKKTIKKKTPNQFKKKKQLHRSHAPFRVSGQFWVVFC